VAPYSVDFLVVAGGGGSRSGDYATGGWWIEVQVEVIEIHLVQKHQVVEEVQNQV
jgi:hypothetical protein